VRAQPLVTQRFDSSEDDRKIIRLTARHDCIDGHLLNSGFAIARTEDAE
jgi:hypothetical protein